MDSSVIHTGKRSNGSEINEDSPGGIEKVPVRISSADFPVTPAELGLLSSERNRGTLADLLETGLQKLFLAEELQKHDDEEDPTPEKQLLSDISLVVKKIRESEQTGAVDEHSPAAVEADKHAEIASAFLTSALLRSSPEVGIFPSEVEKRREAFGSNRIAPKKIESFCKLCWHAIQDFVLVMLIVLGFISIGVEIYSLENDEECTTCWIEGAAILASVCIVVFVSAGIDYAKQFAFLRLTRSLHETNTKQVIREGKQVSIIDDDLVVGDILSINAHNLASIPADCVLLGPATDLKMDESTLTGESKAVSKKPGDVVLSGTNVQQGSAKLVVIAVGIHSVAGKIRAQVYESEDHRDDLGGDDEESPLFVKLNVLAKRIGIAGTIAALVSFIGSCIIGLAIKGNGAEALVDYMVVAITVLAVSVPEGLPLAVTLALAFSSMKMTQDQNLVKHLNACETMGCATTICTDKTGTLTANKMTARALFAAEQNYVVNDPADTLGNHVANHCGGLSPAVIDLLCRAIAINTMNETVLHFGENGDDNVSFGNPTEVALLRLCHELGVSYEAVRASTKGRSDQASLAEFFSEGKRFDFSSARKMMSWAIPYEGGYRLYCKGAPEVLLARSKSYINALSEVVDMTEDFRREFLSVSEGYARRGMRCLALSYRDVPMEFDIEGKSSVIKNADGTEANEIETEMTSIALIGIEDPLRAEVPGAIEKCYEAGIDVRLVTGDNPNTAVSIAYQAGILRDFHFLEGSIERVAANLKENVLMEGKAFRNQVYISRGESGSGEFNQLEFDKIWPHLRILARSSPDDKLTLAHGLNQSNLFVDKGLCQKYNLEDGINIFPDRQVIAMTGDGTNDAPALKRADIGFAMGIAGTQIAKDAADIILLDDNFASIVTAAKWGRNIYASIQKFLQFQLTVNISAVVTALVGSFAYQKSPLAAIQLLWVNLLMDSLASLALASEPPVDDLLRKPPVNRTESMITKHMWANMLGQAAYQITVIMVLLFAGPELLGIEAGHVVEKEREENSVHYTVIFNTFVWMQLFNEINSRKLKGECKWMKASRFGRLMIVLGLIVLSIENLANVFKGVLDNYIFCTILLLTSCLQALIVEFGSLAFKVAESGLSARFWALSLILGAGSLPVQQVINQLYRLGQKYNIERNTSRKNRDRKLATLRVPGVATNT